MKKTLLLAIIFAVLAAFFAFMYLSDLETKYKKMAEPVKVIVATQRITQGSVIRQNMLAEKLVPKEYVQPKAFGGIGEFFSKEGVPVYISLNTIEPDEQILSTKVSKTNQDTGIANIIPEGQKALVVNFDSESSSVITPGSRIDVLSIIGYTDNNKQFQESVYIIAQNLLVLAVGNNYLGSAQKKDEERSSSQSANLTLSVSIEEAQIILLAAERGSLKYIIRPAGDVEIYSFKPVKLSDVIKDISKTAPQPNKNQGQYAKALTQSQKEALEMINKYAVSAER